MTTANKPACTHSAAQMPASSELQHAWGWTAQQPCLASLNPRLPQPAADRLPLPHQWCQAHLGTLCARHKRLAHVAGVEHRWGLHIIPVLPGEGVHAAAQEGVRGLQTRQQGEQPLIPASAEHRGPDAFPRPEAARGYSMRCCCLLPGPPGSRPSPRRHTRRAACLHSRAAQRMHGAAALTNMACSAATASASWRKTCCSSPGGLA